MSSTWKDKRVIPSNPFKSSTFNANWGEGEFTCIHTLNDKDGPWWRANFGIDIVITKV